MSQYTPRRFHLPEDYCFLGEEKHDVKAYIFSEEAVVAVDVALATGRPLLVSGPPGCGKSRLAETMAAVLQWNFLHQTITSRTRFEQLTVEVDHLRRLNDAHCAARSEIGQLERDEQYYNPGIFWWAFNPQSAIRRGLPEDAAVPRVSVASTGVIRRPNQESQHSVLLIDEIDKAEPDLPNDLLEPLDRRTFALPNGQMLSPAPKQALLTIITTNLERELPQAFRRRCVSLPLDHPEKEQLVAIARVRDPKAFEADAELVRRIASKIIELRAEFKETGQRPPGTSEFLDAVHTCDELRIRIDSAEWQYVEQATLRKPLVASR